MNTFEPKVLRPKEAARHLGVSVATLWRFAKNDPKFPKPFKIGVQATGIMRAELDDWLRARRGT